LSELTPSENTESAAKSPEPDFITIGRILSPWGVQGKVRVQIETDFPQRFSPGQQVFIDGRPLTILDISWHRDRPILKLSTIDRTEDARKLQGKAIEITPGQLQPLPEDHYYHFQLIGLEVKTVDGEKLGKITEIITGESNDVYVVDTARGQVLVPAIEDVVKTVNLERGYMEIEPIIGLLELNRKKKD
jgi:16S rRNA processing protein RimM